MPFRLASCFGINGHLGIDHRRSDDGIRMRNRLGLFHHPRVARARRIVWGFLDLSIVLGRWR